MDSSVSAAKTLTFDDLVNWLPSGHLPGEDQEAFAVASRLETFVSPTLRVVEEPDDPHVTLISARGATGKSTLARELSAVTGAPLWRLDADLAVSADALASRLSRYLGPNDPLARFRATDGAFVIVDSLDEARMRVSGASWAEYMSSIAEVATDGHRFVLLGRERILDDVWLDLADAGVDAAWYEISHFDAAQRQVYVDARVAGNGYDTSNEVYIRARDAVLAALGGTVPGPLSDAFVGYAPVLDAVVELLSERNLIAVENTFSAEVQNPERIAVLERVLVSLLEREQGKIEPLARQLELEAAQAYAPEEQLRWLAADLLDGDPPELAWCPHDSRAEYAKQIEPFLRDHPFRSESRWASPVFSAYVAALRFNDGTLRDALRPVGAETGLLYEFVAHRGGAELIDEWQFAALHASLLAAEQQEVEAVVSIAGDAVAEGQALDQAAGELVLLAEGEVQRRLEFELVLEEADRLRLLGPSSYLSVEFPARVDVQPGASSLTLGPDCFISCRDLYLAGEAVQILRRAAMQHGSHVDEASVVLTVSGRFICDATLTGSPGPDVFELHVSPETRLVYPWITYRHEIAAGDAPPDERAERFLNMLMNLVRRHGRKEWGVFDKKLEGRQGIKGDDLSGVLSELVSMGVLTILSPMIFLNEPWASARFDGKGRPGLPTLEDHRSTWQPVLDRISEVLSS
ncbi:MAG TPA: hypothetical protein VNZ62_05905 [Capillimicrobium sp.]|nr:hypothetical protein [Capillimicrobium sp.]